MTALIIPLQALAPVDWATLERVVPEIILVVLFMFYEERRRNTDNQARGERTAIEEKARTDRDTEWRDFLDEERKERVNILSQISGTLAAVATVGISTNQLMTNHDAWERDIVGRRDPPAPLR